MFKTLYYRSQENVSMGITPPTEAAGLKSDMSGLHEQIEEIEQLKARNRTHPKNDHTCWHCSQEGHARNRCPELYPNQSNETRLILRTKSQAVQKRGSIRTL